MKIEYHCRECGEIIVGERVGDLNREKCYEELLKICKELLHPHMKKHATGFLIFEPMPGDDFDFDRCKEIEDAHGTHLLYPFVMNRAGHLLD